MGGHRIKTAVGAGGKVIGAGARPSRVSKLDPKTKRLLVSIVAIGYVIGVPRIAAAVDRQDKQRAIAAQLDVQMANGSPEAMLLTAMRRLYPDDFERFRGEMTAAAAAPGATLQAVNQRAFGFMSEFTGAKQKLVNKAPPERQAALMQARAKVIDIIAREAPASCATFGLTGAVDIALDGRTSPALTRAMVAMTIASFEAAKAAETTPFANTPPTPEETMGVIAAFKAAGGTDDDLRATFGGAWKAMPSAQSCQVA